MMMDFTTKRTGETNKYYFFMLHTSDYAKSEEEEGVNSHTYLQQMRFNSHYHVQTYSMSVLKTVTFLLGFSGFLFFRYKDNIR